MQKARIQSLSGKGIYIIDLDRVSSIEIRSKKIRLNGMEIYFATDEDAAGAYEAMAAMTCAEEAGKTGMRELRQRYLYVLNFEHRLYY